MTKYKNLNAYVDQKNRWNSIFIDHGKENGKDWELNLIVFPLDDGDVDYLMKDIACELSPENLHMDGEASQQHVRRTLKHFNNLKRELQSYCLDNNLNVPECII
tara:strand:- start:128 stop:439 length:312 start_codon:yes stop_codon:yes gene_type:complete